jgi:hypothetical protein
MDIKTTAQHLVMNVNTGKNFLGREFSNWLDETFPPVKIYVAALVHPFLNPYSDQHSK